jgi:DNA modification methylase
VTVRILSGDCLVSLKTLPDQSVNCAVTSPPYFGLRDYGHDGQIGLEESPDEYAAKLVEVFREVRRVLRDDGTLWLNLGDSYAGSGRGGDTGVSGLQGSTESQDQSKRAKGVVSAAQRTNAVTARGSRLPAGLHESARQEGAIGRAWVKPPEGLKQKDLIGVPWLIAFALRADGWYLRQDIIWQKPNPMPHPNTDRCVTSHEYIFLLSKSKRYYFDHEAIQEPATSSTAKRLNQPTLNEQHGSERAHGGVKSNGPMKAVIGKQDALGKATYTGFNDRYFGKEAPLMRNRRSVWTVTTKPFKGAHFATFPPDLIEPCILAGAPTGGIVLDPFGGAGTTGLVAQRHGRDAILCELNPEYVAMAEARIAADRRKTLEALF